MNETKNYKKDTSGYFDTQLQHFIGENVSILLVSGKTIEGTIKSVDFKHQSFIVLDEVLNNKIFIRGTSISTVKVNK